MTFGEEWGWGASKDESRQVFDAFAEAGGNFIDTANMYTNGTSEKMVGEFVSKDRGRFVIATKYTFPIREKDLNSGGNHRKSLVQSVERSSFSDEAGLHRSSLGACLGRAHTD